MRLSVFLIALLVSLPVWSQTPEPNHEQADGPVAGVDDGPVQTAAELALQRQVDAVLTNSPAYQGVTAEVRGATVILTGEVESADHDQLLTAELEALDGVNRVENLLLFSPEVGERVEVATSRLQTRLWMFWSYLPLIGIAVLIVIFGFLLARWVGSWDGLFRRAHANPFMADLIRQVVSFVIILIAFVLALDLLDLTALVGAALGAAGVFGLAVGFAFRDLVENYLASVLLSLRQPFALNDFVDIDGHVGSIARLNTRATVLLTADGNHVRIPNATVFKSTIINYTRNPRRRLSFEVGIDTEHAVAPAQDLAERTLASIDAIVDDPKPTALVSKLGDSSVVLTLTAWVDQREYSFLKTKSEAIRLVKKAFDEAEIVMPEPIYSVRMKPLETAPVRATQEPAGSHAEAESAELRDTSADHHIEQEAAASEAGEENLLDNEHRIE